MARPRGLFLALSLLALGACSSETPDPIVVEDPVPDPVCGNGVLEAGEECDGVLAWGDSCWARGFADGELLCTASCTLDASACILPDEDGDGLMYADELYLGTDPTVFDSDGDGLGDGEEFENGANPLDAYSWPSGMWPNRMAAAQADGITPTGIGLDEVFPNAVFQDQFGNVLNLHQLYGYVVVLAVGASWCPPCQAAAEGSEELFQEFAPQGVVFVELLTNGPDFGVAATEQDLQNWVNDYGLTFPVVRSEDTFGVTSLPTFLYLDRELRLRRTAAGFGGDVTISFAIAQTIKDSDG